MSVLSEESELARTATDPLPPSAGGLELADLPELTSDYLHSLDVAVTRVTGQLVGGQEGTFTVRVTNGPVRLTGWTLHLASTNPDVALIVAGDVTPLIVFRDSGDASAPPVPRGSEHDNLFVFFQGPAADTDSVLDPDEVREFRFTYKAIERGAGTFTAHLHGTVDADSLFPRGRGSDGEAEVKVLRDTV